MNNKLNMSLEAQFHRQLKALKWPTNRMQGEVMGAFRSVVPSYDKDAPVDVDCLFKLNANLAEEVKKRIEANKYAMEADSLCAALNKDKVALLGQLDRVLQDYEDLQARFVALQQRAKQSRSRSLAETLTSTSIGFVGSLCITWATLAAISSPGTASLVATLGCTVWSFARGYSIRRIFNALA